MLFVIHGFDASDGASKRAEHFAAHKEFLGKAEQYGVKIIISGPLVADDNTTPIGSHFVIEAADLKTAEAFHHADPFYQAKLWKQSSVTGFVKRMGTI